MSSIAENLRIINDRIADACNRAGRDVNTVKLIVVTKSATPDQIKEVISLGYTDLGENRVQQLKKISDEMGEYIQSLPSLPKKLNWHMIGHLQRNKVKLVAGVDLLHTVDSARLVDALAARAGETTRVLVQVSLAGEEQKSGAAPADVPALLAAIQATNGRVVARGLMTMPPLTDDPEAVRPVFRALRELRDRLGGPNLLPELSMGMSGDFEVAIEEGATLVRVGTAIFGARG